LEDEAYKVSLEARRVNKLIRERVNHYVKQGVIEVVSDPFAVKMVPIGEAKAVAPASEPTKSEKSKSEKAKASPDAE